MKIHSLPAFYGDCTLVTWHTDREYNVLIDGGPARTYPSALRPVLKQLEANNTPLDLLIITHVDHDHIGGIIKLFEDQTFDKSLIKEVWFNSGSQLAKHFTGDGLPTREVPIVLSDQTNMSLREGISLERMLLKLGWEAKIIMAPSTIAFSGAIIEILSPGEDQLRVLNSRWPLEEDPALQMSSKQCDYHLSIEALLQNRFIPDASVINGSSLSLLITLNSSSFLLLADAFPTRVEQSLRALYYHEHNKLLVGAVKVGHHGSKFNNSPSLYSLLASQHFLVSTDGSRDHLPHKEALARILKANPGCTFHFNYPEPAKVFSNREQEEYCFRCIYSTHLEI